LERALHKSKITTNPKAVKTSADAELYGKSQTVAGIPATAPEKQNLKERHNEC
jgi:hypothetical protein